MSTPRHILLACALLGLTACRSSTRLVVRPDTRAVERPAQAASDEYEDARDLWREAMVTPDPRVAEQALDEALRQLEIAQTLNPGNPLCRSRAGDLHLLLALGPKAAPPLFLESGVMNPARLALARGEYEDSVAISEDWIPGQLGLAKVALLGGDLEGADEWLRDAARSLEKARGLARRSPSFAELVFNADLGPVEDIDPMGSLKPEEQRLASYNSYLAAEVGGWQLGGGPPNGSSVTVGGSFDRLAARIVFLRGCAVAQEALLERGDRAPALLEFQRGVEEALRYDNDWFEATLSRSRALAESGEYVTAADMLEPFLEGEYPLLRRQDWILAFAARARLRAFAIDRDYDRMLLAVAWLSDRIDEQGGPSPDLPLPLLELVMVRSDLFLQAARGQLVDGRADLAETSTDFARDDALVVENNLRRLRGDGEHDPLALVREAHKQHEQAIAETRLQIREALENPR